MISKLTLVNFRRHENLSISFTEGLNGIFGENYTGKTTVLYGILFALGGARAIPVKKVQRKGTNAQLKVEMDFNAGGTNYRITRTKTTSKIFNLDVSEEDPIASGTEPVNKRVESILGMSVKMFIYTRVAKQQETAALLSLGTAHLHQIINEVSSVDEVDKMLDKLKSMVAELKGQLEVITIIDVDPLKESVEKDSAELETAEARLSKLNEELSPAQAYIDELTQQCKELEKMYQRFSEYATNLKLLNSKQADADLAFSIARDEMDKFGDHPPSDKFLSECANNMKKLESEMEGLRAEELKLNNCTTSLQRKVDKLPKLVSRKGEADRVLGLLEAEAEELNLEEMNDLVQELSVKVSELESRETFLREALDNVNCPTCGRPKDDCVDEESMAEELSLVSSQLGSARQSLTVAKSESKQYAKKIDELAQAKAAAKSASQEISDAEEAISQLEAQVEEMSGVADRLSTIKVEVNSARELYSEVKSSLRAWQTAEKTFQECKQRKEAVDSRLATLMSENREVDSFEPESFKEAVTELEIKKQEVSSKTNEKVKVEASVESLKRSVASTKARLDEAEENNQKVDTITNRLNLTAAFQKFLRNNRDAFVTDVWSAIMASAADFCFQATGGRIRDLVRTEDGKFAYVEDDSEELMEVVEGSGCQTSVMGLAVQSSLAKALSCPLDIMLLDEPGSDMDAEHSMATAMLMSSQASQVICVSHSQMDNSVCSNTIYLER